MFTRMLIPLDGSTTAEAVLPYARLLAENLKIPVELMTVIDVAAIGTHLGAEKIMHLDALIKYHVVKAEEYLTNVAGSFPGIVIDHAVAKGAVESVILNRAEADKGTLIAMATHGRSGLTRWLLGSIAEKVLRAANNPLLLVRANDKGVSDGRAVLDSVIVPLDSSELAESILVPVVALAKAIRLSVRLIRCYSVTDMISSYEDYFSSLEDLPQRSKNEASDYLATKTEELKKQGLGNVNLSVLEGEPAEMIIEAAKSTPNSLIAMCTHGRTGVSRWVLGSVTEKVVRHSGNAVLVLRAT
jgi:nucleotide-binding universal stress UspA family protein